MSQELIRIRSFEDFENLHISKGSLLKFKSIGYYHWAIFIGNGKYCHLTQDKVDSRCSSVVLSEAVAGELETIIKIDDLSDLNYETTEIIVDNSGDSRKKPFSPETIVERALSKTGKCTYDLLKNNCEHFVTWCRYGDGESKQVEQAIATGKEMANTAFDLFKRGVAMASNAYKDMKGSALRDLKKNFN